MQNDLKWIRSTRCDSSACVEVARLGEEVAVRQSDQTRDSAIAFSAASWQAFVAAVKAGDLDAPAHGHTAER